MNVLLIARLALLGFASHLVNTFTG